MTTPALDPGRATLDLAAWDDAARPSAVLALPVLLGPSALDGAWTAGPLPVDQPVNDHTRARGHALPTNEETRRTLVAHEQANALYGAGNLARFHRVLPAGGELLALEVLVEREAPSVGTPFALLVAHSSPVASSDPVADLLGLLARGRRPGGDFWGDALAAAGSTFEPAPRATVRTMAFVAAAGGAARAEALLTAYALTSGATSDGWRGLGDRAERHALTIARPDWSALVLRSGGAYVAHDGDGPQYAPTLRMLVHSVHTDALLLALVQRSMIDRSGDRAVRISLDDPQGLVSLEREHFEFRRRYWRTAITDKRTAPPDEVLHAFQRELLTVADVADVEDRVSDGARLAVSLSTARQEASQHELNRLVQNASVIIGAFALAFTAAPVIAAPGWALFAWALLVGALGMGAAFAVLRVKSDAAGRPTGGADR